MGYLSFHHLSLPVTSLPIISFCHLIIYRIVTCRLILYHLAIHNLAPPSLTNLLNLYLIIKPLLIFVCFLSHVMFESKERRNVVSATTLDGMSPLEDVDPVVSEHRVKFEHAMS